MADNQQQSSPGINNNSFLKGMAKDYNDTYIGEGVWTHARNAVNNSHEGQIGVLGNEPANLKCIDLPYTFIGAIYSSDDQWFIFSTDDVNSEIGFFDESQCIYTKIVNDPCLNFNRNNLIVGTSRLRYDCGTSIYWDDNGRNPTRSINVDNIPWKHIDTYVNGCLVRTYPTYPNGDKMLDCEKIRIAPYIQHPCISISKGQVPGTLPNGSYQACIAYTVNQVRVTDYIGLSAVQGLFSHDNLSSSLEINISSIDTTFDEFELVIYSRINAQTVCKRIGYYNTSQGYISVDRWDTEFVNIPEKDVVIRTEPIEKSDALYSVGNYLLRTGVYNKFRFNYQPLANQIRAKWVSVEYPDDYYIKGGNNTGYMRDEQYAFFIRFVYNTGEFSDSYHIPGRPPITSGPNADTAQVGGDDVPEGQLDKWKVYSTAQPLPLPANTTLPDGGVIVANGYMGYWESDSERYPSDKRNIWDSFPAIVGHPLNLCGQKIRHHKFPDETTLGSANNALAIHNAGGNKIRILGVQFENIQPPVDINNNPIPSVIGYEILRGSREGNKTIIAKGLVNNMRTYDIPGSTSKGMFQNYPFNDLREDHFLTSDEQTGKNGPNWFGWINDRVQISAPLIGDLYSSSSNAPMQGYKKDIFSFHSPDVTFSNPLLNPYEFKIYSQEYGTSIGRFETPYKHTKFKFITNLAAALIDSISTLIALRKIRLVQNKDANGNQIWDPRYPNQPDSAFDFGATPDLPTSTSLFQKHSLDSNYGHQNNLEITSNPINAVFSPTLLGGGGSISGGAISTPQKAEAWWNNVGEDNTSNSQLFTKDRINVNKIISDNNKDTLDASVNNSTNTSNGGGISGIFSFILNITTTIVIEQVYQEQLYRLLISLIPYEQYATQYNAYGFYNQSDVPLAQNTRRTIQSAYYIGAGIQQFNANTTINNLNRNKMVVFQVNKDIQDPSHQDKSRFTIINNFNYSLLNIYLTGLQNPHRPYALNTDVSSDICSYYGAMKIGMPNQYGQLESVKQIPISTCITPLTSTSTSVFFGGDIYINRFTEKNTMFFFTDWLMGQQDGYDINYALYANIPYPRFWINSENLNNKAWYAASRYRSLDNHPVADVTSGLGAVFYVKRGNFYLFNSGVRDFFVESEVNVAYRDWEEDPAKRHYDPKRFTDLSLMFRSDIIKSGNYYKYDYNLSISKLNGSHISWGNILPRDYNPILYNSCYTYRPTRVIYSLPQQDESKQDNWKIFPPNNYKTFLSPVCSIKATNKTGAVFMMRTESPLQFMGVEELKLDGTGAKITIGDGKLFETGKNQLQSLVNTEDSFEYGSNQSKYSAVNTTYGLFWVSQETGKVFSYNGQSLEEISKSGMRWWFAKYLPSELIKQYPGYALYDNPVAGIGTQIIFDITHELLYITKRDYKPKYTVAQGLTLDGNGITFRFNGTPVEITNPVYFQDASWTISYDPKLKAWISFHDWHPTFMMPSKLHFMTVHKDVNQTVKDSIWKHNIRCDKFANFYNVDYPFEVEFVSSTGQTVTTTRNLEYLLEAYKYHHDCKDKFHVLDENFDQAIVYNSEQVSGLLKLNLKAKNDPLGMLTYPKVNTALGYIDIQFSKEENKYRFNQFWDITNNRGEYIPVNIPMFNTEYNGYEYSINPQYVNYNKPVLERKKFRHHVNRVFLRRLISNDVKLIFKVSNQKILQSYR